VAGAFRSKVWPYGSGMLPRRFRWGMRKCLGS
jgi:hypothetical protein